MICYCVSLYKINKINKIIWIAFKTLETQKKKNKLKNKE